MNALDPSARAEGVGIAYHPFLHDALVEQSDAFDFVELPLDLYVDAARSALLDPGDMRLDEIIKARRCVWRGTALSLGSVEASTDTAWQPRLIRRVRQLLERSRSTHYTDVIGFRRIGDLDLGVPQDMPRTEAAAHWIAARQNRASQDLGTPVMLQFTRSEITPPPGGMDVTAFLQRIATIADCSFVLDAGDLAHLGAEGAEQFVLRLPGAHIAAASLAGDNEMEWTALGYLAEHAALRSIVLRRDRNLFPLDTIASDAARAAAILARSRSLSPASVASSSASTTADAEGLAALHSYQAEFIAYFLGATPDQVPAALAHTAPEARAALTTRVRTWQNWRDQVGDTHKAQQIAMLLSQRTGHQPPFHPEGRS